MSGAMVGRQAAITPTEASMWVHIHGGLLAPATKLLIEVPADKGRTARSSDRKGCW